MWSSDTLSALIALSQAGVGNMLLLPNYATAAVLLSKLSSMTSSEMITMSSAINHVDVSVHVDGPRNLRMPL